MPSPRRDRVLPPSRGVTVLPMPSRGGDRRRRQGQAGSRRAGRRCVRDLRYNRCPAALQFHHVDPGENHSSISRGMRGAIDARRIGGRPMRALCANCHAREDGRWVIRVPHEPVAKVRGVLGCSTGLTRSGVAQSVEHRLLTERLWVRVPPPEPLRRLTPRAGDGRPRRVSGGLLSQSRSPLRAVVGSRPTARISSARSR